MAERGNAALASALRDHALAELARACEQLARRGSAIHEGVHQARKSLRRARAVLDLGAGALGRRARRIDRALRQLGRSLSSLRDAHARIEVWDRHLGGAALPLHASTAAPRRAALVAERSHALRVARAFDPGFAALRAEIAGQRDAVIALDWDRLDGAAVRKGLARSAARLQRARRRAHGSSDAGHRHRWRRRVRRLRQQQNALQVAASTLAPKLPRLGALAEALGEEGELLLLREHFAADPIVIGALEEALREARKRGDRLGDAVSLKAIR